MNTVTSLSMAIQTGLLGSVVGMVLAMTGAGGGVIAVPLLVLVLHWPISNAAPTALIAVGLASGIAALNGLQKGLVRWRAALLMGSLGTIFAPVGVAIQSMVRSDLLLSSFSVLMFWLAWRQWPKTPIQTDHETGSQHPCVLDQISGRFLWTPRCAIAMGGTGIVSGLLSGLIGVGGGFVIIPSLTRNSNLDRQQVQLTSLAVIALVSVSSIGAATAHGNVDWWVAMPFAMGAIVSMMIGRKLADSISKEWTQRAFSGICVLAGTLLIARLI